MDSEKSTYEILEASHKELRDVKERLKKHIPCSITVYGLIDVFQNYGELKCVKPKFFLAKDQKFSSFIFVSPVSSSQESVRSFSVFWILNEIEDADVGKLLINIPNWDWNFPFAHFVSSYRIKLKFDELMKAKIIPSKLCLEEGIESRSGKGIIFTLLKEDLKEPKIPEGYEVRTLNPSFAADLLAPWEYNFSESVEGLEDRLSVLKGVGAFKVTEDRTRKEVLVAWTHQYMSGIMGMTYSQPEERRKGLAGAVTLTLAKRILDDGRTPYAMTESTNVQSTKFHQKLGFRIIGECGFSMYVPEGMTLKSLLTSNS